MDKKVSVPFMLLGILFVVCLIVSNFFETKLIQVGPVSATAGLLVFPISYIINDCIAEVWGYKKARMIIWSGFAMNFFVVLIAQLAVVLPAAPFWEGGDSFNFIFGMTPRIVVASLCAFLVGSFINAFVMSKMKIAHKGKYFSLRAIVSTLAGEGADSMVFFPVAFGGLVPGNELMKLLVLQVFLKSMYEVLILPLTIRFVKYVKQIEHKDTYDHDISFNPFKVGYL